MNNDDTNEQIQSLTRELDLMRERYSILADVHGRLQNDNSLLEERILSLVETYSGERNQLEQDLLDAKRKVFHLQETVEDLEVEKQQYKDDCNLAVRLLHRHPNQFVSTTSSEHILEHSTTKNESTLTNHPIQPHHSLVIPTFPPTFVTALPLLNTTPAVPPPPVDSLRLAEALFKTNTVHRYPSTHFTCSNCHRTINCRDVSVQTSLDDHTSTTRARRLSLTISDDELPAHDPSPSAFEPHHSHLTVQEYQAGNRRRPSQELGLSSDAMPQMHHI